MPLTREDLLKLRTWSFVRDYETSRYELVELARVAYESTEFLQEAKPGPGDCVELYMAMLMGTEMFQGMVARKRHLSPAFYESMCLALAKYVLHTNWTDISFY